MASVYQKRGTWYLQVIDAAGRRRCVASKATTKKDANGLAVEMEAKFERQRLGQEPADLEDGGGTVDELMAWWIRQVPAAGGVGHGRVEHPQAHHRVGAREAAADAGDGREGRPVPHREGGRAERARA